MTQVVTVGIITGSSGDNCVDILGANCFKQFNAQTFNLQSSLLRLEIKMGNNNRNDSGLNNSQLEDKTAAAKSRTGAERSLLKLTRDGNMTRRNGSIPCL